MRSSLASEALHGVASALRISTHSTSRARCPALAHRAATTTTSSSHLRHTRAFSISPTTRYAAATTAENGTAPPAETATSPRAPNPSTAAGSTSTSTSTSTTSPSNSDASFDPTLSSSLTDGLRDPPPMLSEDEKQVDWTRSFHGLSAAPFSPDAGAILTQPLSYEDIEVKPDGIVYLPEIKYRRILNRAFGPGGWGLAPRGETIVTGKLVTREYALICNGRLVSIARGEQVYFDVSGIPTATEGCKSNALMRCCKDLGVASELWDPRFIKKFLAAEARETVVEHLVTKKRRKHWMRRDDEVRYPFKEVGVQQQQQQQQQQQATTAQRAVGGGVAAAAAAQSGAIKR